MSQQEFEAKVLTHMGSTGAELKNINGWMGKIDAKVDKLQTSGCAKGIENEHRIGNVENEPRRKSVHGAIAGGGIAASLIAISEIIKALIP